jgi:ubiquinol-cytochrome c reductase cytochrome c subunit
MSRRRTRPRALAAPLVALLAIGAIVAAVAHAQPPAGVVHQPGGSEQELMRLGAGLFAANCASCHGLQAEGTEDAPTLIGVGAASVDFQVGTGRMPMAASGPQAEQKPVQFTEEQIAALATWVASLGPGPAIPDERYLQGDGDLAVGAELFRINCAMCHNVAGAGGALTEGKYAPALYNTTPLNMYAAMVTGPQNMPVFNDMTLTTEEKRDIISYLLFLQDTQSPGGFTLGSLGPVSEGLFIWIFGIGSLIAITVWITAKSN